MNAATIPTTMVSQIGMRAVELLRLQRPDQIHSRKLRSFSEVAFQ